MDKEKKESNKKALIKDNIKVIIGFLIAVLAVTNIFLVFELNRIYQSIEILNEENSQEDEINDTEDFKEHEVNDTEDRLECTLTVTNLNDIHPIEGCAESRLTIENLNLNKQEVTVTAIFTLINEDYFYSLRLSFNDQEVVSDFFTAKEDENDLPSYIWTDDAINFFTISENGVPTLLAIHSRVAGQGQDEFLQVINSQGEVVLELKNIYLRDIDMDSNNIADRFSVRKSDIHLPTPCDADLDPDTIIEEVTTYEVNNGVLKIIDKETFTYDDCH